MNGMPYGRRQRPVNHSIHFINSFKAPVRENREITGEQLRRLESQFYNDALKPIRKTKVTRIFK